MRIIPNLVLAATLAANSLAAHAAGDAPVKSPETVVVTGQPIDDKTFNAIVRAFVDTHGSFSPKIRQMSRWVKPVCPQVANLTAGMASFIADRVKSIATDIGARVDIACKPNVDIIFTSDPQAVLDTVVAKDSRLIGFHFANATKRLSTVTRPVQAWYVTATSNGIDSHIDDAYHGTPNGHAGSLLGESLYSEFIHVLIVVDINKIEGSPIGPLADNIAMLALSQSTSADSCSELSSILNYFTLDCQTKPEAITAADRTFLEGLYFTEKTDLGSFQKNQIARHMRQEIDKR